MPFNRTLKAKVIRFFSLGRNDMKLRRKVGSVRSIKSLGSKSKCRVCAEMKRLPRGAPLWKLQGTTRKSVCHLRKHKEDICSLCMPESHITLNNTSSAHHPNLRSPSPSANARGQLVPGAPNQQGKGFNIEPRILRELNLEKDCKESMEEKKRDKG